jgi:predicted transcriptional regulator
MTQPQPTRLVSAVVETTTVEQMQALAVRSDRTFSAELRRALREHVRREVDAEQTTDQGDD